MTDKEKIKEEIERRIVQAKEFAERAKGANDDSSKLSWDFVATQNKSLLQFIDSLPEESGCEANFTTKSEDLDFLVISLEETIGTSPHSREVIKEHLQKAAEWQKQKMKEALQTEYEKGRFDMREDMMKDAVETTIVNDWQYGKDPDHAIIPAIHQRIEGCGVGDKVKIIIVKTERL